MCLLPALLQRGASHTGVELAAEQGLMLNVWMRARPS